MCSAFGGEYPYDVRFLRDWSSSQILFDSNNQNLVNAVQIAQSFINNAGIQDVRVGDIFVSADNIFGEKGRGFGSDKQYYVICFERIVGDRTIDFTFHDGTSTESDYDVPTKYEKLQVWIDGNQVVQFLWEQPLKVKEVININTAVQVDYEQALELAVNNLYSKYAYVFDNAEAESITINIEKIEFDMVRVKELNSNYFISVPAWKFYGDVVAKRSDEEIASYAGFIDEETGEPIVVEQYYSLTAHNGPNIVTVNALDSSIVDMTRGY